MNVHAPVLVFFYTTAIDMIYVAYIKEKTGNKKEDYFN